MVLHDDGVCALVCSVLEDLTDLDGKVICLGFAQLYGVSSLSEAIKDDLDVVSGVILVYAFHCEGYWA